MSTGFLVRTSSGAVSISSTSYNLVYAGRAVLMNSGSSVPPHTANMYSAAGVTAPILNYYGFYFDAPDSAVVIPFFSCPGWCGMAFMARSGAVPGRWEMEFFATQMPTVYCFTRLPASTVVSGHGLAVWNEAGGVAYFSGAPHLVPKDVVVANSHACDPYNLTVQSTAMVAPSHGTASTPLNTAGLMAPILHFACPNSGAGYNGSNQFMFALVARLQGASLETRWGLPLATTGTISHNAHDSPLAIVAEGAYF